MNFKHQATVPVGREKLWDFLLDVEKMATCVPGVEEVKPKGDDQYEGRLKVSVGPIRLTLQGTMAIKERDAENWTATVNAEANDRRVGGGVNASATMRLTEAGPDKTDLVIDAEARLLGKLGEFGQPVIRKKAEAMMAQFADNVSKRFS